METAPGNATLAPQPSVAASSSSNNLAMVVDKRPPHRPGGCVGIFFHLFDWNRRLAKKRFFSRKLLPQDRAAKRISKRFAGDERMPAATMPAVIAAENRGGFLNTKKVEPEAAIRPSVHNSGREKRMIAPGLVARLMGLESMPAAAVAPRLDRPRKEVDTGASASDSCCHIGHAGITSGSPCQEPKLSLERGGGGHGKLQLRPQKEHKLGLFDRWPGSAARGTSEALLFSRGMLARSRKQQYKLASPVKSPRLAGRRSSARLMEAATRILEPGLQSRNRRRCALTYVAPLKANVEGMDATPLQRPNVGSPFVGSCHNCGSVVEVPDLRLKASAPPMMEYGASPSSSDFSSSSFQSVFDETVPNPLVILKENKRTPSLAVQAKANVQSRSHYIVERSHSRNELQEHSKPQSDATGSTSALKQHNSRQNQVPLFREKVASTPRLGTRLRGRREPSSFNESRNFLASDRNLGNCTRTKTTKATMKRRLEMERNAWERKSLMCKGKSIGNNNYTENAAAINSAFPKKKIYANIVSNGKGPRLISARSIHENSVNCEIQRPAGGKCGSGSKSEGVHSLTICAGPAGNRSMPYGSVTEERGNGVECGHEGISKSGTLSTNSKAGKLTPERALDKRINALSILLEQKIRELTCLDVHKSKTGDGVLSSRPTAVILEELISSLSAAQTISLKKGDSHFGLGMQDESCYYGKGPSACTTSHGPGLDTVHNYQAEAKSGVSAGILHNRDYEQHSPMSILEASFSNDSCLSESFNSCSGHRPHAEFTESSFDKLLLRDLDTDLSDSATSSNIKGIGPGKALHFIDDVSFMHNMGFEGVASSGSKINYFREVICNAELLFGNNSFNTPDGAPHSPIHIILLDTLETLVDALRGGHNCNLKYSENKDVQQFRCFLFDYIIEHLDMKYGLCSNTGYNAWAKMPFLTGDRLALGIYEEIIACGDQDGEILDEIVQKEIICMDGRWMEFQVEAFEAGAEIENDLLQMLVDEIVISLLHY